jgi:hypothetical protein
LPWRLSPMKLCSVRQHGEGHGLFDAGLPTTIISGSPSRTQVMHELAKLHDSQATGCSCP